MSLSFQYWKIQRAGTLKTFSDIVTYTLNHVKLTFLFHLMHVTFQRSCADAETFQFNKQYQDIETEQKFVTQKCYYASKFEEDLDCIYSFWEYDKS